jgi:hypothetical protein
VTGAARSLAIFRPPDPNARKSWPVISRAAGRRAAGLTAGLLAFDGGRNDVALGAGHALPDDGGAFGPRDDLDVSEASVAQERLQLIDARRPRDAADHGFDAAARAAGRDGERFGGWVYRSGSQVAKPVGSGDPAIHEEVATGNEPTILTH